MNLILNMRFGVKYCVLFLSLLFAFSCSKNTGSEAQGDMHGNDSVDEPYRFPVIVMKVRRGILSNYIALNGDVDTKVKANVYPDVTGKITSLNVKLGTYVTKGQVIATLDPTRIGALYLKSPVRAPISGNILTVGHKVGETVGPQASIALIGKMDTTQIRTYVSEKYILDVKAGNDAIIEIESYPDEKFRAKVSEVSPVLDFKSRTAEIYLEPVGNNSKKMIVGMFVKIKLVTNHLKNVVKIPSNAVVERDGKSFAFRVNESTETVEMVPLLIDFEVDNIISVRDGINEGDLIVIEGLPALSDGAYINLVDTRDGIVAEDNV
ncbi:efflux RND transporter periplasmic adaptor subunit [Candidatus Borreliella tachyglossi]|uniref:Efflux RND transporter periplasmic adaptor subunit n=1 Tax=Candidatus Borreliella tachyglossi TaxID=1964448 RepID=A0A2S1LW89_9SPIR|nr:efflux RND transporter periplasmic adaptor subunit [Candidatus Borreliella tachyglossi]AWG42535.1 efflux RND transporter periplasmic adaptor subunit [Candidatus Borreliella tachyglossi]